MTIEHRLAHAGFTLTRDYPVAVEKVWDAFANEEQKRSWFRDGETFQSLEWAFDFRVADATSTRRYSTADHFQYEAVNTDIVEHVRIVTTYDMWLDGIHIVGIVGIVRVRADRRGRSVRACRARCHLRLTWGGRLQPRRRIPRSFSGPGTDRRTIDPRRDPLTAQATCDALRGPLARHWS